MQAVRVHEAGRLRFETVDDPVPAPGEALVELRAAALNRRDLLVTGGTYPFPLPLIPGSDGAGVRRDTGEEVVVYPMLGWGDREDAPAPGNVILGGPRDGTYAELVVLPVENLYPRPAGWSWEESSAFLLAALTGYRALVSRGGLRRARRCSSSAPAAASRRWQWSSRCRPAHASRHLVLRPEARAVLALEPPGGSTTPPSRTGRRGTRARPGRPRDRLGRLDVAAVARVPASRRSRRRVRWDGGHGSLLQVRPVYLVSVDALARNERWAAHATSRRSSACSQPPNGGRDDESSRSVAPRLRRARGQPLGKLVLRV